MLQMNVDDEKRELLEAQRRYREQYASQYTAGYTDAEEKYVPIIEEKDATIAEQGATIAEKEATIAEQGSTIIQKDAAIKILLDQLKENGITPNI